VFDIENNRISELGKIINYLNLPPLQAKMIIDANFLGCTDEIINILATITLNFFL
jgi:hypothetical protein